jgi:alkyl hydroperoxide reductase subunit AhpC
MAGWPHPENHRGADGAPGRERAGGPAAERIETMLTIGDKFPAFALKAVVSSEKDKEFKDVKSSDFPGQWKVVFFWPKDFTFVCPTEIAEFGKRNGDFNDRDAQVLGVSTDNEYVHLAWRKSHPDLKNLPFPMVSDLKRELSTALGVLNKDEGVANRATFIVDPQDVIRFVAVTDLNVGRSVDEVIRVLDALQTDELCPCNWKKGDATLEAA